MKIVLISNLYPPFVRGGAEIVVTRIVEGLRKNLQHVSVITTRPYGGVTTLRLEQVRIDDVPAFRFYPLNLYFYTSDYRYPAPIRFIWHLLDVFNFHSYYQIRKILLKEKPDVVLTHNLMGIGFLIPKLIRKLKIRHIHTVHDVQLYNPSGIILKGKENDYRQKMANALGYKKLMMKLLGSPDVVISPSQFLKNFYSDKGYFKESSIHVIPNPTDIVQQQISKKHYELELIYLGQLTAVKGILELIDVIKELPKLSIRLNIVGLGPDLNKALKLTKGDNRFVFYGWRPRREIIEIFSRSDVLVLPSICYENSPTVVYEALGYGIPVLVSKIGGAHEVITEGKNGWTFEAGNWKRLKEMIKSIYGQRDRLKGMSPNCLESVRDYSMENYIKKLLELAQKK